MALNSKVKTHIADRLKEIQASGLHKLERVLTSPQDAEVDTLDGKRVNFSSNNYLGLANHPEIVEAAREGLRTYGFGIAAARFICGTQDIHRRLEQQICRFLGTDETILYTSCFDANGGLFETVLEGEDCVISDELNHASIIDGIRLCKAHRKIYRHADLKDLRSKLEEASDTRLKLIATDGVFSMDGDFAPLAGICELAEDYNALVMIDDSHATGLIGSTGRGTPEYFGLSDRVDIITSTLGKALGGASGGFTTGRKEIVDLLRQRSRPYLFSNSIAPPIVMGALKALEILDAGPQLVRKLHENTDYFRGEMTRSGFNIPKGSHPIVPIILGDEALATEMAEKVNQMGLFVVGFSFPIVPLGKARIRVQVSALHTRAQLDGAVDTFARVGKELGVLQ